MAMAITNSRTFPAFRFRGWDSWSTSAILCRWGTMRSTKLRQRAPTNMPATVMSRANSLEGKGAKAPPPVGDANISYPYSTEGMMSPSTAAASITPAAKARTISLNRWEAFLKIKPISAPITVAPPTPRAVSKTILIVQFSFYEISSGTTFRIQHPLSLPSKSPDSPQNIRFRRKIYGQPRRESRAPPPL